MNAVRYVLRTGCQWRQLPKDFPPRSTVYNYFWDWTRYGVLDRIHHKLLVKVREMEGREASPTAAIIDTQAGRFQGYTQAMGDRTDVVLAPTQSTPDGPLRSICHHRRRLRKARNDKRHAAQALSQDHFLERIMA
jgi:transposase